MSTWLFDLGNTRLKFAPLEGGAPGAVIAMPHAGELPLADLRAALPARFDTALVASVGTQAQRVALLEALTPRCARISLARTQSRLAGVRIAYAQPERLGVDRFLALLAAHRTPRATLLCGVGTALTIDLLDADGVHHGGLIAPSPTLMRDALHARAPHLPLAGGAIVDFADDTIDALASGCDGAAIALIERSVERAQRRLGVRPQLRLHGGGADALLAQLPEAGRIDHAVLQGLAIWARATA